MFTNRRVASLLLLLGSGLLFGQNPEPWKEYVYADDGFAVSAPTEPQLTQKDKIRLYRTRNTNNERMTVTVLNVYGKSDQEVRDMMKENFAKDPLVVQSSIQDISYAASPALRMQRKVGDKSSSILAFCIAGRSFLIEVSNGADGERFINSFRLVESPWKDYAFLEDGLRLSSPAQPRVEKDASSSKYTVDLPGGGFILIRTHARTAPDPATAQRVLVEFRDRTIARMGGKLTAESVLSSEVPAIAFELDTPPATHIRGRMYYAATAIYIVLAKGTVDADHFFNSLHIAASLQ